MIRGGGEWGRVSFESEAPPVGMPIYITCGTCVGMPLCQQFHQASSHQRWSIRLAARHSQTVH
mgnify:CR=1 FL=1